MKNHLFSLPILLVFTLLSMPSSLLGQKCQTSEKRASRIAQNPKIAVAMNQINQHTEDWIATQQESVQIRAVETVPVVVHVVWLNSSENISEAQIMSQIDVLNEDFRKLNSNASTTPAAFAAIAADVEIEFCLAKIDPNGNPTNGITRTQTTINEIGETEFFYSTTGGGHDPWDNTKYINIWICNQEAGSLGFATPPGTADPPESDGVVIPSVYFGTIGTAANSAPNHLGRTATHEIGHYFNLEHIWGPGNGGCNEDDFVSDTPNQDVESGGCPTFPFTDNCTSSGSGINFQNYLDYSDDDCMTMFTEGQKMRMLAALNGPRASLLNSNVCVEVPCTTFGIFYIDTDGDGFGDNNDTGTQYCIGDEPSGYVANNVDCDDNNNNTDLFVNGNPIVSDLYEWQNIFSIGFVAAAPVGTAPVEFEGYYQVVLEPGFQAIEGSDFTGRIASGCPTSVPLIDNTEEDVWAIEKEESIITSTENQLRIFPNPLQNETTFEYALGQASVVNIVIVDAQGSLIERPLSNQYKDAGVYNLRYNADQLNDGIYMILLSTEKGILTKRMVVVRE